MSLIIGTDPDAMTLLLEDASDFEGTLTRASGDWPAGATLSIVLPGASWEATITGADAAWYEPLPTAGWSPKTGDDVALLYTEPDGTDPSIVYHQTLAKGRVVRK